MRPIYKRPGEDMIKQVEDKVRTEVESKVKADIEDKIKTEVDRRVVEILKEREEKDRAEKAARLAAAVDKAKSIKGDIEKDRTEKEKEERDKTEKGVKSEKEGSEKGVKSEKERTERNKEVGKFIDIPCPTCAAGGGDSQGDGHIHKLDTDNTGLVYKCNNEKCGFEYVLTPRSADYKCSTCGLPIKKPGDDSKVKDMSCPFCHGTKAVKFDWSKLQKVSGK